MAGGNLHSLDDLLIVECTHNSCVQPKGFRLQKNVLTYMSRLYVGVDDTAAAIFLGASRVLSCYGQHDRGLGHPHLA